MMETPSGRLVPDYWNVADGFAAYMDEYTRALRPVPTAVPALDELLHGGFRPGIHFIGGNTGAGKTAFCLWLMERMASLTDPETGSGYGCTYVSLELAGWEVRARLGSRLSRHMDELDEFAWADFEDLGAKTRAEVAAGTYEPEHDPVYVADLNLMALCPNIRIVDGVRSSSANSLAVIESEVEATGAHGGRVCFVDYLQCIDAGRDYDEQEAMRESVRSLNLAGMRSGVAVICIAAVNRAKGSEMASSGKDKNPGADIFRGSSWIEYTGLSAFALVRRRDARRTGGYVEVELWPVKNRRGESSGPIEMAYDGAHGDFVIEGC